VQKFIKKELCVGKRNNLENKMKEGKKCYNDFGYV
jgi:hypothetical protein